MSDGGHETEEHETGGIRDGTMWESWASRAVKRQQAEWVKIDQEIGPLLRALHVHTVERSGDTVEFQHYMVVTVHMFPGQNYSFKYIYIYKYVHVVYCRVRWFYCFILEIVRQDWLLKEIWPTVSSSCLADFLAPLYSTVHTASSTHVAGALTVNYNAIEHWLKRHRHEIFRLRFFCLTSTPGLNRHAWRQFWFLQIFVEIFETSSASLMSTTPWKQKVIDELEDVF